jgi:PhnB protein
MPEIQPYLTFPGNCEEAFNFYKSIFGGDFDYIGRYKDMPSEKPMTDEQKDKIMHVSLRIGKNGALMGSDSSDEFGHATVIGTNISLSLNADSEQEADQLFTALSAGGKSTMPMQKTFWGSYFGMLTDKFSIQWMISAEQPKQ